MKGIDVKASTNKLIKPLLIIFCLCRIDFAITCLAFACPPIIWQTGIWAIQYLMDSDNKILLLYRYFVRSKCDLLMIVVS